MLTRNARLLVLGSLSLLFGIYWLMSGVAGDKPVPLRFFFGGIFATLGLISLVNGFKRNEQ